MNREYNFQDSRNLAMAAEQENHSQEESPFVKGARAAAITIFAETAKGSARGAVEGVREALEDSEVHGAERIKLVVERGAKGAIDGAKEGFKRGLKEAPVVFAGVVVEKWLEKVLGGNASVSFSPAKRMAMSTMAV